MERGLRRGDPFLRVKFFLTASYEIDSDDFLMGLAEKLALDIWDAFRDMSSPFCWNSGPRLWIPQGGPFFWPLVWTHVKRKPLSTKPNQTKPHGIRPESQLRTGTKQIFRPRRMRMAHAVLRFPIQVTTRRMTCDIFKTMDAGSCTNMQLHCSTH